MFSNINTLYILLIISDVNNILKLKHRTFDKEDH